MDEASVITTPWDQINGKNILEAMEKINSLEKELVDEHEHHHHHHDGDKCCCGHDHDHEHHHDEECGCGHDHHDHEHHHDEECGHDHHDHEHHHDGECGCGHHHEHGHHHADDVFTSMGIETAHKFTEDELSAIIDQLAKDKKFGEVLRAKGIVPAAEGEWFHFDLVPEETEVRRGAADFTGRVCVIGSNLEEDKIKELFKVS